MLVNQSSILYETFATVLLIFFAISIQVQASNDFNKKSITDSCDRFMKLFQTSQPKESIKILKNITVTGNESLDKLALQIFSQMEIMSSSYGEAMSYPKNNWLFSFSMRITSAVLQPSAPSITQLAFMPVSPYIVERKDSRFMADTTLNETRAALIQDRKSVV